MADHCQDFSRAQAIRAAARAGNGLPAVEAGMPLPAGTGLSRRSFMVRSAGLALSVYGARRLSLLPDGIAQAAAGRPRRVLVQVFLPGGVDSMTLLAPVGDPRYAALRGSLALPGDQGVPFGPDHRLHWHPAAAGLAGLADAGQVAVMPAVGYSHPDQSHFVSRHFYEVGALDATGRTGWLGRYLDRHGSAGNPLQGLSLDSSLAPALAASRVPVAAVDQPDQYTLWTRGVYGKVDDLLQRSFPRVAHARMHGPPAVRQAAQAAVQAATVRRQLRPFAVPDANGDGIPDRDPYRTPASARYPHGRDPFPQRLAALASLLAHGLPLHCVSINAPGQFDTHADQAATLPKQLKLTFDSLAAFQRDLEARGLADRVLVHVWSEFGRRAQSNGSGTDHGAGGIGLVIGRRVRGQMIGEFPGLESLDPLGNLRVTSDFRGLYCALLEQWLGVDAAPIIPGARGFHRAALVR